MYNLRTDFVGGEVPGVTLIGMVAGIAAGFLEG